MTGNPIKNYDFFGLPVSSLTIGSLEKWILSSIETHNRRTIYGYSLYSIYALRKIPEIFTLGSKANIFLTDGRPFFWLCKLFKVPLIEGISIPQFVIEVLKLADKNHFSVMLLGATKEINGQAYKNIKLKYSNIVSMVGIDGYFRDDDVNEIIDKINKAGPDILFVGMSSPKKERFVFNNLTKINASIIVPCGGMIDILAGKTKMTPDWLKKIGFAFLFRIVQEPRRLLLDRLKMIWFLFTNFFVVLIVNYFRKNTQFSIPEYYLRK